MVITKSGFVAIVGRPNGGKSTLLNSILGTKVSIVSNKAQTTRTQVRGVLNREDTQIVFVDTPGIHKPKTALGTRLNDTATDSLGGVDKVLFVIDATAPFGTGDQFVADRLPSDAIVVVNKVDIASPDQVITQLQRASELDLADYFPVSAKSGKGVDELVKSLLSSMPEGPALYPEDVVTDVAEAFWVAELVREQLFAVMRQELPYSIATRVTEWDWPRIRCEILVERDSQKGMVIGQKGEVLRSVGIAVREQLVPGAYLELVVRVAKDWQRQTKALERLGY